MPERLSASQRAHLVLRLLDELFERDWTDIDVILTSFQLPGVDLTDNPNYASTHAQCRASLQSADSATLMELAQHVLGETVTPRVEERHPIDAADDLWGSGTARIFLSHLASDPDIAAGLVRGGLKDAESAPLPGKM